MVLVQRVETPDDAFGALARGVDILVGQPSAIADLPGVTVLAMLPDGSGQAVMGERDRVLSRLAPFGLTIEAWVLKYIELTTPENLNEVPFESPGGDQQSEETPPAASRTILHRQLFPVFVPDNTLRPIPAGATHYALRRLADGLAVDFWGSSDWKSDWKSPNCPRCGYPDKAEGGPFKGIYTPGKPCDHCGYSERHPVAPEGTQMTASTTTGERWGVVEHVETGYLEAASLDLPLKDGWVVILEGPLTRSGAERVTQRLERLREAMEEWFLRGEGGEPPVGLRFNEEEDENGDS